MCGDQPLMQNPGRHIPRRPGKDGRRADLLQAALAEFLEKGFAGARVEDVAARAGVSKGTLFLHFASKGDLFRAVVHHNIATRFRAWDSELARFEGSSADLLRQAVQLWWQRVGATPEAAITRLMVGEAGNFPDLAVLYQNEVVAPGMQGLRRILQRAVASGEFRPMDVEAAASAIVAPMACLAMMGQAPAFWDGKHVPPDASALLLSHVDLLLNGLCAGAVGRFGGPVLPAGVRK